MSFSFVTRSFCALVLIAVSCTAFAQQPSVVFAEQCSGCHTIGGGAGVGPDLKGVGERRERAWLVKFIHDPQAVIRGRDRTALALQKEFGGLEMPAFPDITKAQAEGLVDYIAQQSVSAPAPNEVETVFEPQAVNAGKQIFLGERRLARGGAACVSCHTVRGLSGLGGGRLGPDLTRGFERLRNAKSMAAWLTATPSPVMGAAYKRNPMTADEVRAVTAFLQDASKAGDSPDQHGRLKFMALAVGLTVLGFVVIGESWRGRLRSK